MKLFRFLAAFALFVLLVGCGGFLGSDGTGSSPGPTNFKLSSKVVELDKSSAVVVNVGPNSVDLTGAPVLTPGQIIIHNALDGKRFVRKVVSSVVVGPMTTVSTAPAGVEDVFETANILQKSPMAASDLAAMTPALPGVTFKIGGHSAQSKAKGRAPGSGSGIDINFVDMQLKDSSNNPIVEINGSIHFDAGIETKFRKSLLSVDEFGVAPYVNINGTLKARGRTSGSFVQEIPISLQVEIPVTPLGPLGINCNVQFLMRLEGSYSVDGQFTLTASVSAKEGVHYDKSTGWTLVNQFDKSFDIKPPSLHASLEMGVSLVRPKIGADILGIGEVHVTADVVKVIGRVTAQTSPVPGFNLEGIGDFGFTAGGSVRLGPLTLWNDSRNFTLGQFNFFKSFVPTLNPTDSTIAYTDLSFANIHVMNGDGTNNRIATTSPKFIFSPNVSNRNGKLCYAKFNVNNRAEVWTANNDGTGPLRITDGTLSVNHLSWSPDGTEIAFDASDSGQIKQVYVVTVSNGAVRQMTNDTTNSRVPTWTPDGSTIYFERFSSAGGKKAIARTSSTAQTFDWVLVDDTVDYAEPSLSPNGLQLVCLKGGSQILISDERGRGAHVILDDSHVSRPSFSPDGQRIILQYNDINNIWGLSFALDGSDQKNFLDQNQLNYPGQQFSWGLSH